MTERVKLNLERKKKKIIPEESTGIKLENDKSGKRIDNFWVKRGIVAIERNLKIKINDR